jgi:hypothetical protein
MKTKSQYRYILALILILAPLFFPTIFFGASETSETLFLVIIILWAISLPIFSSFHHSFIYVISLPAPIFGSWFLLTNLLAKYVEFSGYWALAATGLSILLVFAFHFATRSKTMFWKASKSGLTRSSIAASSAIFIFFGIFVLNPSGFSLGISSEIFYFSVAFLAYVTSSMLNINYQFRVFALNNRIGVTNVQRKLTQVLAQIEKRFPDSQRDFDVLQYYFRESLTSFLDGDFERSFIWGYKVIREKTVVNPCEYVNDKREGKPSLSDIRNTLEHSRRKGHVDTTEIKKILRNLFGDCLDLLQREFELIKLIAEA